MHRGPTLRSRFRERERSGGKVEGRQRYPTEQLAITRAPPQPTGDHEMNHQIQIIIERKHDALAKTVERTDVLALDLREGRVDRPKHEGAESARTLDRLAHDAGSQRFEICE